MTTFPLGRIQRHDPRSLGYPAPSATVGTVSHTHYGPVLDQGQLGSCTGNAMAQGLNTAPFHRPRSRYLTEDDALVLYSAATRLDPWPGDYPPTDTGSSGVAVCKAAKDAGLIGAYTWAFGLDHTLGALMLGPVLAGTVWYENMFYPDRRGFVTTGGQVAGGHEYLLTGINMRGKYVWALNSWSADWGRGGRFKLSLSTLEALLADGGDIAVPS